LLHTDAIDLRHLNDFNLYSPQEGEVEYTYFCVEHKQIHLLFRYFNIPYST